MHNTNVLMPCHDSTPADNHLFPEKTEENGSKFVCSSTRDCFSVGRFSIQQRNFNFPRKLAEKNSFLYNLFLAQFTF